MKFLNWLVFSSENPKETALTIQGILVLQIPLVLSFLQSAGIEIAESQVAMYVTMAIGIFGALLTFVGICRKLYNTFSEEEVVVFKAKKKSK